MTRLASTFERLNTQNKAAFIAYIMAGDPDSATTLDMLKGLVEKGVDIIELGVPFTDPMADGPTIQRAAIRALEGGMTFKGVLDLVKTFRQTHTETPIVLMGYANPFHMMGFEATAKAMADADADGLICVDIPPEEDKELRLALDQYNLSFIRLAAPTTDERRLPQIIENTSGFVYYVSNTGVTGGQSGKIIDIKTAVDQLRSASGLPVVVGFGVKTPSRAAEISTIADGVVVGSALVDELDAYGTVQVLQLAEKLADAVKRARYK